MASTRVVSDPAVMMGKPVIEGTRITVELILEDLAGGRSAEEILDSYPHLPPDAVSVALSYAAAALPRAYTADGVREPASSYAGRSPARRTVEVDVEEYKDLRYRVDLFQGILKGMSDADAGHVVPHEEAMAELLARYGG